MLFCVHIPLLLRGSGTDENEVELRGGRMDLMRSNYLKNKTFDNPPYPVPNI